MADTEKTPRILALVGMPGSGKSLCAEHLQVRGFFQFRFGSIVVDEVQRSGMAVEPENERRIREKLRKDEGMDVMAKRALPILRQALLDHQRIVIDGLYSFSEYKTLQQEFNAEMILLAIACARDVRYDRLAQRPVRPLTREEAESRDWAEIENLEKGGPIAIADYTLVNDDTTQVLIQELDALLDRLGFHPG